MFRIGRDQHLKILGFALIGYGLQFVPNFLMIAKRNFWPVRMQQGVEGGSALIGTLENGYDLLFFIVISLVAGISTLSIKARSKIPGVLFVLATITLFPLGTILSGYVLLYLFVISESDFSVTNFNQGLSNE